MKFRVDSAAAFRHAEASRNLNFSLRFLPSCAVLFVLETAFAALMLAEPGFLFAIAG